MKAIKIGLEKLETEVEFWTNAVNDAKSAKSLKLSLYHARNATEALGQFKEIYADSISAIKKYPFLGEK
jgi:hypothetical protein